MRQDEKMEIDRIIKVLDNAESSFEEGCDWKTIAAEHLVDFDIGTKDRFEIGQGAVSLSNNQVNINFTISPKDYKEKK